MKHQPELARASKVIRLDPHQSRIAIALGERVVLAQWAGAALVIAGVLFSSGALDTFLKPPSVEPARS